MKILILILAAFLTCCFANANFIAISEIGKPSEPVFAKLKNCVKQGKGACIDISDKNIAYHDVKNVEVDDYSKPVYDAKRQVTACSGRKDCIEKLNVQVEVAHPKAGQDIPDTDPVMQYPDTVTQTYCTDYGYQAYIAEGFTEVYCTKWLRWAKKIEKRLVENASKKAQWLADRQKEINEKDDKQQKREARMTALKQCATQIDDATNAQLKTCIKALIREQLKDVLKANEM